MRRVTPTAVAALLAVVLTVVLAGCGGSSGGSGSAGLLGVPTNVRLSTALHDTANAPSLHVVGEYVIDTQGDLKIDLRMDQHGDCRGVVDYIYGTISVIGVHGTYWIHPDAAFLRYRDGTRAAPEIRAIGAKYLPADHEVTAGLDDLCDLHKIFNQRYAAGHSVMKGSDTVEGVHVERLDEQDGPNGLLTAYVLPDSPHYIARLHGYENNGQIFKIDLTMSAVGAPVGATPPPSSQVFTGGGEPLSIPA